MATFSLNSCSLSARNCILATNKQFTKSPLQQAAALSGKTTRKPEKKMKEEEKYFTERFVANRYFSNKILKTFNNIDFEKDYDKFHELREIIRQPVQEWQSGKSLPDYILDERDEILERLNKYNEFELPLNPTKEDNKLYAKSQIKKMETDEWKEWSSWLNKTKSLIKTYPKLEDETLISREILDFYKNGRNIFEISPFLIQLLKKTDIGNIRYKDLILPYNKIYLHFGGIDEIEYNLESYEEKHDIFIEKRKNKFILDGAFVSLGESYTIDICLCFKNNNDDYSKKVNLVNDHRFPAFKFTLSFGEWNRELGKTTYNSETTFSNSTVTFYEFWDPKSEVAEIDYSKLNELTNQPENCNEFEFEQYVTMDNALKLIINSICFLNSTEKDVEKSTTNQDATILIDKLNKTKKSQEKFKLKEKIDKLNYSKIHFLGNSVKKYYQDLENNSEVEPHWRRGHWRNQAFGTGLTETKLIWIKPTIVRKDKGEPKKGHIYNV